MSDVVNEAVPASGLDHFSKGSIGTSAVQLSASATRCAKGVQIKADPANTGVVYIGKSDVTANTAAATDGYPLAAGEEVFIPVDLLSTIYAIGSAAGQKVFVLHA